MINLYETMVQCDQRLDHSYYVKIIDLNDLVFYYFNDSKNKVDVIIRSESSKISKRNVLKCNMKEIKHYWMSEILTVHDVEVRNAITIRKTLEAIILARCIAKYNG